MEKCRPANVKELEVKAKRFIVSQWQGLSPVLSVCSTKDCIWHINGNQWFIGFICKVQKSTRSKVLLSFDKRILNQPHSTSPFTFYGSEKYTHIATALLIDFELKILSRIQKYPQVKVKQCTAHSDLQTLNGFWANNDRIGVFDSKCISSQLILNRSEKCHRMALIFIKMNNFIFFQWI